MPAAALLVTGITLVNPAQSWAAPAQPVTCGSTITQNTTLATDVGPCPGDGIIIAANHVQLNLNGHRVFGLTRPAGASSAQNVGVEFQNVTGSEVSNGEVTGFSVGVRIDGGSANRVREIYAHDNIAGRAGDNGDGIAAWNSSYNTIERNVVTHNGPYSGIALVTGDYSSSNGTLAGVNPAITETGNAILDNEANDNNVSLCTSAICRPRDPNTGQQVASCPTATSPGCVPLFGLTTGSQDTGISIEGPDETSSDVERNVADGNGNNGIMVHPSCHDAFTTNISVTGFPQCVGDVGNIHTLIKNNEANHNGYGRASGSGITLFGMGVARAVNASDETVTGNTTNNNYSSGVVLYSSGCNEYARNDPRQCASLNNTVERNTAMGNRNDGIDVQPGSDNNQINRNTVNGNGAEGLEVEMAPMYDANYNPITDANGNIIYVAGSGASNNVLDGNSGMGNVVFDGEDINPMCDHNDWDNSSFAKVNQSCVLDSENESAGPVGNGNSNGSGSMKDKGAGANGNSARGQDSQGDQS
jgi:parallel beta-helix repeat protein